MPCIAITLPIGTGMGNHMEFKRVRRNKYCKQNISEELEKVNLRRCRIFLTNFRPSWGQHDLVEGAALDFYSRGQRSSACGQKASGNDNTVSQR